MYLENESEFKFEDLFFSRTNNKGIIESGNSVFQNVSKYEWDEILKRPHNIIRHPSMPKAVFFLLWDTILQGKPIGAYVINKAKDHSYYWVFAVISPIDTGFLSIRLKPSSPLFKTVKLKYSELLNEEKSKKLTPSASSEILMKVIESLNFRNYDHFMTEALLQELDYRQKERGLSPILTLSNLQEVTKLGLSLQLKCEEIFKAYKASAYVPLNLEVQTAKIGQEAAPIAVVSSQYDDLAKQIQTETKKFIEASKLVIQKVEECQFFVCNSILQNEMITLFKNEDKKTPIDKDEEIKILDQLCKKGVDVAKQNLREIDHQILKFNNVSEEVKSLSMALEIVSITGKIEASKIQQKSGELLGLLQELAQFKFSLKKSLKEIDEISFLLVNQSESLKKAFH